MGTRQKQQYKEKKYLNPNKPGQPTKTGATKREQQAYEIGYLKGKRDGLELALETLKKYTIK